MISPPPPPRWLTREDYDTARERLIEAYEESAAAIRRLATKEADATSG